MPTERGLTSRATTGDAADDSPRGKHIVVAGKRLPRSDREICKICGRNGLVVKPPFQLIERGADVDVGAVYSCDKQVLDGGGERLPRMEDARHLAGADSLQDIV